VRTAIAQPESPAVPAGASRAARAAWNGIPGRALPAGLIVLHVVVQLLVRPFPRWFDALRVMDYARAFPHRPPPFPFSNGAPEQHALRIGSIAPEHVLQQIFGYGQVAFYAFPFLMGIVLVLATYALGRMLLGRSAGALAALLIVLEPILVRTTNNNTSWQLLPDVPAAALFVTGVALVVAAGRRVAAGNAGRAATWSLVAAGACFGWAYLARELVVFLFPVIVVALLLWRVPWRRWWLVALPMLGALGIEMAWASHLYGDPLARWTVASAHTYPPDFGNTRVHALVSFWRVLTHDPGAYATAVVAIATLVAAAVTRRRALLLAAAWFLALWAPLTLLGGFIDPQHVSLRVESPRYWVPLLPALALGAAGLLTLVAGRRGVRARLAVAGALATAVVVVYGAADLDYIRHAAAGSDEAGWTDARWSALRTWLHDNERRVPALASDGRTAVTLDLMYRYAPIGGAVRWHGRVVVVHRARRRERGLRPADVGGRALLWSRYTSRPRPRSADGWRLAWQADNASLAVYLPPART
jgi:4-amino-4-deoxy-L-arabinose transferase-like glycosyltransferase